MTLSKTLKENEVFLPAVGSRAGVTRGTIRGSKPHPQSRTLTPTAVRAGGPKSRSDASTIGTSTTPGKSNATYGRTQRVVIDGYSDGCHILSQCQGCIMAQEGQNGKGKPVAGFHFGGSSGSSMI